jgi:hypothetical protein
MTSGDVPEPESSQSRTFDIAGDVEGSTFEDIDSTADTFMKAASERGNRFSRIRHRPTLGNPDDDGPNWTKMGAIAAMVAVPIAIIAIIVTIVTT